METGVVKGIFMGESPGSKAVSVEQNGKHYWIPRSVIPHMHKSPPGRVIEITLHVQEWWLEKSAPKGLEWE